MRIGWWVKCWELLGSCRRFTLVCFFFLIALKLRADGAVLRPQSWKSPSSSSVDYSVSRPKTRNKPKSQNSSKTSFSSSTSAQPPPAVVSSPSKPISPRFSSRRPRVPRSERRSLCRGGSRSIGVLLGGEVCRGERFWRWISYRCIFVVLGPGSRGTATGERRGCMFVGLLVGWGTRNVDCTWTPAGSLYWYTYISPSLDANRIPCCINHSQWSHFQNGQLSVWRARTSKHMPCALWRRTRCVIHTATRQLACCNSLLLRVGHLHIPLYHFSDLSVTWSPSSFCFCLDKNCLSVQKDVR